MVKVSVCLICYNQEKYIEQTLQSIFDQHYPHLEVIIADDCSTDNSKKIIESFLHKNQLDWNFLPANVNVGMQKNWQNCIEAASGDYIALLEGDDFWNDSEKIQKQVEILEQDKTLAACFTNSLVINEMSDRHYPEYVIDKIERLTFRHILKGNNIPTCTVLFRRHKIDFPPAYFKSPYVDWIIHLSNAKTGDYFFLDEKTSTYRLHENGAYGGQSEINRNLKMIRTLECLKLIFSDKDTMKIINQNLKDSFQKVAYLYKEMNQSAKFYKFKIKSKLLV
jgi:glycosyltransferase involved in cell wall biosynthesis